MACSPELPLDVVRLLFEEAAWSDHSTAHALNLVSKDVRQWTNNILYHTVTLGTPAKLCALADTVTSRDDRNFLRRTVKVLSIGELEPSQYSRFMLLSDSVEAVLEACTGIERFAFWIDTPVPMSLPIAMNRQPTHVSLVVGEETNTFAILSTVSSPLLTHLHIDFALFHHATIYNSVCIWPTIFERCPGLIHLQFSGDSLEAFRLANITQALDRIGSILPKTLTRLVISAESARARTKEAHIPVQWQPLREDPRIVFVLPESHELLCSEGLKLNEKWEDDFLNWGFVRR